MRVLLTGATGFVGSRLRALLASRGHDVVAVARAPRAELPRDAATWIQADLREPFGVPGKLDAVVHAGALVGGSDTPAEELAATNARGTRHVVEAALAAGATRLVYFSSLSAYGEVATDVVDEATPIRAPGDYGRTKLEGEHELRAAGARAASVSLRLPGILPKLTGGPWLTSVLGRARSDEPIAIFGPDAPFNNAVDREDLSAFVADLLGREWSGHEVLTLAAGAPLPLRSVVEALISDLGSSSTIEVRPSASRSFTVSNEKAVRDFGYRPRPIRELVRRLAAARATAELGTRNAT